MDVLLNWLVQGVIVAIAAAAGLRLMPASSAAARYGFIWAAYLLVLALPMLPLVAIGAIDVPAVELAPIPADPVLTMPAAWWTSPVLVIGLLSVWSVFQGTRLVAAAAAMRHAKRHARQCPRELLTALPHWSHVNATGRSTRVVLSKHVRFAAVLGCGSPIIALAPELIQQLSVADLDRVLVHEWAHVQRRDDVIQFVQRIVRTLVGWHPAAWWLQRQLEFEREAACDEIAVTVTGSTKAYAACLTTLAALPQAPVRSLPVLAAVSPSTLRRRLVRILALPSVAATRRRRAATLCAAGALAAVALAVANVRTVASVPTWTTTPPAAQPAVAEAAAIGVSTATSVSVADAAAGVSSVGLPPHGSNRRARSAGRRERGAPFHAAQLRTIEAPPITTMTFEPLRSTRWTGSAPSSTPIATPTRAIVALDTAPLTAETPRRAGEGAPTPWGLAADAGEAIGRSSQNAGVATAGFFTRFGKRIARSF